MTGAPDPQDEPTVDPDRRIVVDPEDVTMPGDRDPPLRQHVIAAMTFSSLLVIGFLAFVALLFVINAIMGR